MDTHVVIMAGGIGSRFWPMSTPDLPKQFVDVMGVGKSLIQMTYARFVGICPPGNFWVVTGEKYVSLVKEHLPDLPHEQILAEPAARNTAPCIAYACWKIRLRHPSANIVVTPSDALVLNPAEFRRVIGMALDFTVSGQRIVTIGIRPSRPETGYGYIETGREACAGTEVYPVKSFREKPRLEVAREYLEAGGYLWNAGIFVWSADTITGSIRKYAPSIAGIMDEMSRDFYTDREHDTVARLFPTCEKISIDYAVMEKASGCIYTIPADFGWSDLGTWGSLRMLLGQDEDGNAAIGKDVRMFGCRRCIVHAPAEKKVIVQGMEDCIIAEHDGRLLVCRLDHEQEITGYIK